ncbi:conserved Plasmodium protein, unknown function [Plasmodium ovale wallikeri]|uniref:Helicase n=1 Tax=Plasmodium ovale wallikeri TaxID=864142 RepID=A0A1A9A0E4_PLAOA|nr:conserved Plasmodium protein, unknown function [Plasmodium ovale wallikeri]
MSANGAKRTYKCLYTHQKTQKNKKWKEGYCELVASYGITKISLLNENRGCVESSVSSTVNLHNVEEDLELPNHLIQLVDLNIFVEQEGKDGAKGESKVGEKKRGSSFLQRGKTSWKKKRATYNSSSDDEKGYANQDEVGEANNADATSGEKSRREILIPLKRVDRYAHTNRRFEVPRKILQPQGNESVEEGEHKEKEGIKRDKDSIIACTSASISGGPTTPSAMNRVSGLVTQEGSVDVTYTHAHLFGKKKNVKWYDGYIVEREDTIELYNCSGDKLCIKKKDNIFQDQYIPFGNYIVYNSFLNEINDKEDNENKEYIFSLNDYNLVGRRKTNRNLHYLPGRNTRKSNVSMVNTSNVKTENFLENDEKGETKVEDYSTRDFLRKGSILAKMGNTKFSDSDEMYPDVHLSSKRGSSLGNENSSPNFLGCVRENHLVKKDICSYDTNEHGQELPLRINDGSGGKVFLCRGSGYGKSNISDDMVNIGKVVSKNLFSSMSICRKAVRVPFLSGLLKREGGINGSGNGGANGGANGGTNGGGDAGTNGGANGGTNGGGDAGTNGGANGGTNGGGDAGTNGGGDAGTNGGEDVGQVPPTDEKRSEEDHHNFLRKEFSLFEGETLKKEEKKNEQFKAHVVHMVHRDPISCEEKAEKDLYCDVYEIKSMTIFSCDNSNFCASDIDNVSQNNLFIPIHIIILKNNIHIRKKLSSLPYFKIKNFFINKSEYIFCFMNAILFQIYYEVTNKILLVHEPLIDALADAYDRVTNSNDGRCNQNHCYSKTSREPEYHINLENCGGRNWGSGSEDDYVLLMKEVEVVYSVQEGNSNKYGKGTNVGSGMQRRFFLKITMSDFLLIGKNTRKKIISNSVNTYVNVNHIILFSKRNQYIDDDDLLVFITKWNSFRNNYLEIFPLNLDTFAYMNELFRKEKIVTTKEYIYFLRRHKKTTFPSCLFLIKIGDQLENLKYLFYFYRNVGKTTTHRAIRRDLHQSTRNEDAINYDIICRRAGVKSCMNCERDELILLDNVSVGYKSDLARNVRDDGKLNRKQRHIVECMLSWFMCRGETDPSEKGATEKGATENGATENGATEKGASKEGDNTLDGRGAKHRCNSTLLVNGIFGSGKSTLICKVILYLDKLLTCEEKSAKSRQRGKSGTGGNGRAERNTDDERSLRMEKNSNDGNGGSDEGRKSNGKRKDGSKKKRERGKKILLMCNTNLGVDNILLKLKMDFEFYNFARIGNIFEINFFLITNFVSITSKDDKNVQDVKRYLENITAKGRYDVKKSNYTEGEHTRIELTKGEKYKKEGDEIYAKGKEVEDIFIKGLSESSDTELCKSSKNGSSNPRKLSENELYRINDMDTLINILKKKNDYVLKNKYKNKRVIAGTCKSLLIFEKLSTIKNSINYLIVDESTQIDELTLLRFFMKFPIKKIILIGDVKQLGFVLKSRSDLTRSMFSRLIENELFIRYYLARYFEKGLTSQGDTSIMHTARQIDVNQIIDQVNGLNDEEYAKLKRNLHEHMFDLHHEKSDREKKMVGGGRKKNKNLENILCINKLIIMNKQYRCHPTISNICSHLFYGNQIENARCTESIKIVYTKYDAHVNIILIRKANREIHYNSSFINVLEANIILQICESMIRSGINPDDIGIISLFKYQTFYIQNKMKDSIYYHNLKRIKVSTVDSFQGIEKEIILFSCVLCPFSNEKYRTRIIENAEAQQGASASNSLGIPTKRIQNRNPSIWNNSTYGNTTTFESFYENKNRINVALSRAKSQLIIVAHKSFVESNKMWSYIRAHSRVCYYD